MFEREAERLIKAGGWHIALGPHYNANLGRRGIHVWSIKSVLSKEDLKKRGIKASKNTPPGSQRTVRFRGVVEDGVLVKATHLTTSQRKKLASGKRGRTRTKKTGSMATPARETPTSE